MRGRIEESVRCASTPRTWEEAIGAYLDIFFSSSSTMSSEAKEG